MDDVCFFEAKPTEETDGRKTSQNLTGYGHEAAPVYSAAVIDVLAQAQALEITKVDEKTITSMNDLSAAKKAYKAGDTATITYYRDGAYQTTELTFDEQPLVADTTQDGGKNQQGGQNDQYGGQYPGSQYGNGFDMFDLYEYFFGRN